jgi:hypothetical protein
MVGGIVFNIQFFNAKSRAQPVRAYQGRKARVETDSRFAVDRQKFAITPQVALPRSDFLATDSSPYAVIIVANFERTETLVAHMIGLIGVLLFALAALKP